MAEYRPSLTPEGREDLKAEIFLYDTLAGGAGPHSYSFTVTIAASSIMSLEELRQLDKWLQARLKDEKAQSRKRAASDIVLETRKVRASPITLN